MACTREVMMHAVISSKSTNFGIDGRPVLDNRWLWHAGRKAMTQRGNTIE